MFALIKKDHTRARELRPMAFLTTAAVVAVLAMSLMYRHHLYQNVYMWRVTVRTTCHIVAMALMNYEYDYRLLPPALEDVELIRKWAEHDPRWFGTVVKNIPYPYSR